MLNSVAIGRRLARRAVAWQLAAMALVALAFLARGPSAALAAGLGAAAVAGAAWLSARIALGGGVAPAAEAMLRMFAGIVAKWVVVVVVLVVAVWPLSLPAVPLAVGAVVALLVQFAAMLSPR